MYLPHNFIIAGPNPQIAELHWHGTDLFATCEVTDTEAGAAVHAQLLQGKAFSLSLRGWSSLAAAPPPGGHLVVADDLRLITFDLIAGANAFGPACFLEARRRPPASRRGGSRPTICCSLAAS